jgi:hypothetical protein
LARLCVLHGEQPLPPLGANGGRQLIKRHAPLNGAYTQQASRRHGLSDYVFQGRFNAILVDADNYLLERARYVVRGSAQASAYPPFGSN